MKIKEKVLNKVGEFEEVTSREKLLIDLTLAEVGKVIDDETSEYKQFIHYDIIKKWAERIKQKLGIK